MSEIRIKYVVDDSELSKSIGKWQALDKESEELIKDFKAVNAEAAKAGTSIANAGSKGADGIKKTSKEAKQAKSDLTDLEKTASRVGAAIVGYFSFTALLSLGKDIVNVTAEFQKFRAVLTNTLGDKNQAESALKLIQEFAATTPFSVQELTNAFVKLANSGFVPTRAEMTKLGDLAASTGKSFDQLTEAILDANTFQFERLKEFGVKAEQEGNKIRFTFKGVTTEVQKTSQSVQEYLLGLGSLEGVSGSMAAISQTLEGQISNLGDSIDQVYLAIGDQGSGGLSKVIGFLNYILGELKNAIVGAKSDLDPLKSALIGMGDTVTGLWERITELWGSFKGLFGEVSTGNIIFQTLGVTLRVAMIPMKLLIQQIIVLIDGFKLLKNAVINLRNIATGKPLISLGVDKLKQDAKNILDIITLQDGQITHIKDEQVDKEGKREKKKTEVTQKELDERFKKELDNLNKLEQLAVGRAKVAEKSESDIIRIHEDFNQRRERIFERYGKQRELDYQFLKLKEQELEKQYTDFIQGEEEERNKIRLQLRDEILKNIDSQTKAIVSSEKNLTNQLIEVERERFRNGEITLEQYYNNLEQITYEGKKAQLEAEIKADQEKLNVTKLTAEQVKAINQDIIDKQKELNDLEFKAYEEKEKKKTELTKEEIEKRKELQQQALDVFIESVNAGFDIAEGRRTAQLENLKADTEERLRLAGDNEKKKQQILEQAEQKEKAIKTRQAQADRAQAIFNIGITTALNVIKALGQPPIPGTNFVAAALAGAAGAAQLAVVLSKPIPKFAKGSKGVTGGIEGQDSVLAMLMPGEKIVPTAQSRGQLGGILDGIIDGKIKTPVDILKHAPIQIPGQRDSVSLDTIKELKGLRNDLKNLKQANISLDKNGFKSYISSQNSKTEFLNNYFNA